MCVFVERVCESERDCTAVYISLLLAWNPCDTDVTPWTVSSYLLTGVSCHSEHKVVRKFNLFNKTAHSPWTVSDHPATACTELWHNAMLWWLACFYVVSFISGVCRIEVESGWILLYGFVKNVTATKYCIMTWHIVDFGNAVWMVRTHWQRLRLVEWK